MTGVGAATKPLKSAAALVGSVAERHGSKVAVGVGTAATGVRTKPLKSPAARMSGDGALHAENAAIGLGVNGIAVVETNPLKSTWFFSAPFADPQVSN